MNTLTTILLVLAGIIILLLAIALFMRKDYLIRREVIIKAPLQKVFDYVVQLKNQDNFNKWVMVDPGMKKEFSGTDGTVGFIYTWNSEKKGGEGELEIKSITPGENIETEIRFVRPFTAVAHVNMSTEQLSENEVKVTWSNASTMKYPLNLMLSSIEKMMEKDMDTSLDTLKNILEK